MVQLLEMQGSLQNFNLNKIYNGKFKSQTYATWTLHKTKKVSQNGISYISVTYSSKSVPFLKAKKLLTSKWMSTQVLAGSGLSTVHNTHTTYSSGLTIILAPSSLQFTNVSQTVNNRNYDKQQWYSFNGDHVLYSRNEILHSSLKLGIAHELLQPCRKWKYAL